MRAQYGGRGAGGGKKMKGAGGVSEVDDRGGSNSRASGDQTSSSKTEQHQQDGTLATDPNQDYASMFAEFVTAQAEGLRRNHLILHDSDYFGYLPTDRDSKNSHEPLFQVSDLMPFVEAVNQFSLQAVQVQDLLVLLAHGGEEWSLRHQQNISHQQTAQQARTSDSTAAAESLKQLSDQMR
ncbi:unnamed protein product, partial [Amoebophrya sp. A120]|eukprot:GSA120T00009652001.1